MIRRFRYWLARKITGYGEIHLTGSSDGWVFVSVTIEGKEIQVIREFVGDIETLGTMSHWVTELGILDCYRKAAAK